MTQAKNRYNFLVFCAVETVFCMYMESKAADSLLAFRKGSALVLAPKRAKNTFVREIRHDDVISQSNNGHE